MGGGYSIQSKSSVRCMIEMVNSFSSTEEKVIDKIFNAPLVMVESSISEAAELCGVSEATIVRFCKHIGYSGFYQMKLQLSHDIGHTQQGLSFSAKKKASSGQKQLFQVAERIQGLSQHLNTERIKQFAEYINNAPIVHVFGCGQSRCLALDIVMRLNNRGIRAVGGGEYISEMTNLMLASSNELLLCVSKSGETRRVINAAEIAKSRNLKLLALTGAHKNPLSKISDLTLSVGISSEDMPDSHIYLMSAIDCILTYVHMRNDLSDCLETIISNSRM